MGTLLQSGEPWFAAAATLLIGVGVALAVGLAVRVLARRMLRDEDRAQHTALLAFWGVVVIFGLLAVTRLLAAEAAEVGLTAAGNRFFTLLPDLVVALVLLVVGSVLATAGRTAVLRRLAPHRQRLADPVASVCGVLILTVAALLAARQVGIQTALVEALLLVAVAAGLLALGIAAGLGGRGVAAAVVATRHTKDILTVGDLIEVDGQRGRVLRLGATSVRLHREDGTTAEVPNTRLLEATVVVFEHEEAPEPAAAPEVPRPAARAQGGATAAGAAAAGAAAAGTGAPAAGTAAGRGAAAPGPAPGAPATEDAAGDAPTTESPVVAAAELPQVPPAPRADDPGPARDRPAPSPAVASDGPAPSPAVASDGPAAPPEVASDDPAPGSGSAGEREPTRRLHRADLARARAEEERRAHAEEEQRARAEEEQRARGDDDDPATDVLDALDRPGPP